MYLFLISYDNLLHFVCAPHFAAYIVMMLNMLIYAVSINAFLILFMTGIHL